MKKPPVPQGSEALSSVARRGAGIGRSETAGDPVDIAAAQPDVVQFMVRQPVQRIAGHPGVVPALDGANEAVQPKTNGTRTGMGAVRVKRRHHFTYFCNARCSGAYRMASIYIMQVRNCTGSNCMTAMHL